MAYIVETVGGHDRLMDVYSRLLKDRVIFLGSAVTDETANEIVGQLLFLDSNDPGKPINLYINSPGGAVTAGLAILDTMRYIKSPVNTICIGLAASMGALLLACGTGTRSALPNASIMIHQPSAGTMGKVTDMEIDLKRVVRIKRKLNEILAEKTKQPIEVVERDAERDYWMDSDEAVAYGIIDNVVR